MQKISFRVRIVVVASQQTADFWYYRNYIRQSIWLVWLEIVSFCNNWNDDDGGDDDNNTKKKPTGRIPTTKLHLRYLLYYKFQFSVENGLS